jgi:nitrate reductase NapAB chaperone NapD
MKTYQEWKDNVITEQQAKEYIEDYTQMINNLKSILKFNGKYLTQNEQEEIKGTIKILALYIFNYRS